MWVLVAAAPAALRLSAPGVAQACFSDEREPFGLADHSTRLALRLRTASECSKKRGPPPQARTQVPDLRRAVRDARRGDLRAT